MPSISETHSDQLITPEITEMLDRLVSEKRYPDGATAIHDALLRIVTPPVNLFWFTYLLDDKSFFRLRDGSSFAEIFELLRLVLPVRIGYQDVLKNLGAAYTSAADRPERPIDDASKWDAIQNGLVVSTTRIPLHDEPDIDPRPMQLAGTYVEFALAQRLRESCFEICKRPIVRLNRELANLLPPGRENRADIDFFVNKRQGVRDFAAYQRLGQWRAIRHVDPARDDEQHRTAGYVIYQPHPHPQYAEIDFRSLVVFGLSGDDGLRLSRLLRTNEDLRTRFADMLTSPRPRFLMIEMAHRGPVNGHESSPFEGAMDDWDRPETLIDAVMTPTGAWQSV